MSEQDSQMVTLVSADGKRFVLPARAARLSGLVSNVLDLEGGDEDNGGDDKGGEMTVDIPKAQGDCLGHVVEFLNHHVEEAAEEVPSPLPADTLEKCVTQEWYRNYILRMDRDPTFALMQAANYMDIKPLLDLVVLRITFEICGKPPEEIRAYLKLAEPENNDEKKEESDEGGDNNNEEATTITAEGEDGGQA